MLQSSRAEGHQIAAGLVAGAGKLYRSAMTISLRSVQVGRVAPLGPNGVPSGFIKLQIDHRVGLDALGLLGDAQADLTVHGGPEKAVYGYASEHYAA